MSTIKAGRKPKSVHRAAAEAIIAESAPQAAGRIRDYAAGKIQLTSAQLDACKYLVDQAIGRATQRQEISGDPAKPVTIRVVYAASEGNQ